MHRAGAGQSVTKKSVFGLQDKFNIARNKNAT